MTQVLEAVTYSQADTVLTSVVGTAGLLPTISAIEAGKNIALSNKETLVTAGKIITDLVRKKGVSSFQLTVSTRQSFNALPETETRDISRLILTASGGPFREGIQGKRSNRLLSRRH